MLGHTLKGKTMLYQQVKIDGFVELQLLDECKCEHCGSILERRYKIPTEEDIRRAKPWRYENE